MEYPAIAEYRWVSENNAPKSVMTEIAAKSTNAIKSGSVAKVVHISQGYEIAGSMMRWTNEVYAFNIVTPDGTRHGRRFRSKEDALSAFEKLDR